MNNPVIVFDLDGTLADTAIDLLATLNRIVKPYGLPPASRDDFGTLIGQGARAMISSAFESNGSNLSEEVLDDLFDQFLKDYSDNIAVETKLFDGVSNAMDELEDKGYKFAICTNKTEALAIQLLEELNVARRFSAITGGNTFAFKKPDGRHVSETVLQASGDVSRSIMVGDSFADIEAARNAGIPSIAVTFGYSSVPVAKLEPDFIINHFNEIVDKVEEIESRRNKP